MTAARRWWLITALWLLGVAAAIACVLLVSAAKGGILAARHAPAITVQASQTSAPVDLGPLWVETTACNVGLAEVRWQLEALLPHVVPAGRERLPSVPRGARPPKRAESYPPAGLARRWRKSGW